MDDVLNKISKCNIGFGIERSEDDTLIAGKGIYGDDFGEPPKSIITFDKKCLSCSDQPQKLITAFKMACLTYLPGNITYNFQEYSRPAMISILDKHVGCLDGINQETTNLIRDLGFQLQFE